MIIDNGVSEKVFNTKLEYNMEVNDDLSICNRINYDNTVISHGTICAGIMQLYNKDILLSSIKVMNRLKGNMSKLCMALKWCLQHNIRVINISLGSVDFQDFFKIRKMINTMKNNGYIIICASQNRGCITYPASLSNVIGVKCDKKNELAKGEFLFSNNRYDGIEIIAFSKHFLINDLGEKIKCINCNSFATPMITAKVCEIIFNKGIEDFEQLKLELIKCSKNVTKKTQMQYLYAKPDWIKSAIIFSSHNNTSLASYYFTVIQVVPIKLFDLSTLYDKKFLHEFKSVDTIILMFNINMNKKLFFRIKHLCEKYNKSIVCIDNETYKRKEIIDLQHCKTWSKINKYIEINNLPIQKKNSVISVPIIFVYFEIDFDVIYFLQLLKKNIMKKKYNVNVIMDIPQSVLYDFDYIPKYYLKSENERVIAYLNTIIDKKKIDINILGINNQDKVRYNKISLLLKPDMEIYIDMRGKFIKIKTDDVNVYKKDFDLYINTNINRLADYIVNKFSK